MNTAVIKLYALAYPVRAAPKTMTFLLLLTEVLSGRCMLNNNMKRFQRRSRYRIPTLDNIEGLSLSPDLGFAYSKEE